MAVRLACGALVDEADLPLIAGLTLRLRKHGHVEFKRDGRTQTLHRLLLDAQPGQSVDHINGNPMDNRRANLRLCSHAENMQNRRIHRNNSTGFKGVWFDARRGTFRAQVSAFGKKHCLGSFTSAQEAAQAYLAKAAELHGEFFGQPAAKEAALHPPIFPAPPPSCIT